MDKVHCLLEVLIIYYNVEILVCPSHVLYEEICSLIFSCIFFLVIITVFYI